MTPVFQQLTKKQADIYSLVLSATGIEYQIEETLSGFEILTEESCTKDSLSAVRLYLDENMKYHTVKTTFADKFHTTYSGLFSAFLLFIIHWQVSAKLNPDVYTNAFGSSASKILGGEYFRCATSLFLHGSDLHLIGNMAGIIIFGTSVCSITGSGLGWCMIIASGFLGNYFNACFYESLHISIGASTAVFGAIGILAGQRVFFHLEENGLKVTSLIPIGAGLALLALLGSSPNSDFMAHFFGYIAGIIAGVFYKLFIRKPLSESFQTSFLILAALIIAAALIRGHLLYF